MDICVVFINTSGFYHNIFSGRDDALECDSFGMYKSLKEHFGRSSPVV